MSDNNNNDQQQQQQREVNVDPRGNVVRGRAGNLMGMDRGPQRGGVFESLDPRNFESSPNGASSSVQGWVLMISNLSPNATQNDLELFLTDVDPTSSMLDENDEQQQQQANDPTLQGAKFISDIKMNPSAEKVCCLGHAFVKTPKLEWAHLIQSLNGRPFVDDLEVAVDFTFKVPPPSMSNDDNNNNNNQNVVLGKARERNDNNNNNNGPSAPVQEDNQ